MEVRGAVLMAMGLAEEAREAASVVGAGGAVLYSFSAMDSPLW